MVEENKMKYIISKQNTYFIGWAFCAFKGFLCPARATLTGKEKKT